MKKVYGIEVDCANCANLMETAAAKVAGVKAVSVSFMTQKITVEFAENANEKAVMKAILKACQKVDPDCGISL